MKKLLLASLIALPVHAQTNAPLCGGMDPQAECLHVRDVLKKTAITCTLKLALADMRAAIEIADNKRLRRKLKRIYYLRRKENNK